MAKRTNGEGTYGKKKIGKYNYFFYRSPNGKYIYARTQKELKEKVKKESENDFFVTPKTTFGEYVGEWLKTREKMIEPKTYDNYEISIRNRILKFADYDLGNKQLSQLSQKILQDYINALAGKYARGTIILTWTMIKQCIKDGDMKGEIDKTILNGVNIPKESAVAVKKKEIPFFSLEESEIFYEEAMRKRKNGSYYYRNNGFALVIILYTGMRVSELIALKWKNVDLENNKIKVEESTSIIRNRNKSSEDEHNYISIDKTTKTASSVRTIPLPKRAVDAIKHFKEINKNSSENDYVCFSKIGSKASASNLIKTIKTIIKNSGIDKDGFTIHALRHSYGSILLANGVDIKTVSELLGHKNITTTYNVYIGVLEKDKSKDVSRVFDNI